MDRNALNLTSMQQTPAAVRLALALTLLTSPTLSVAQEPRPPAVAAAGDLSRQADDARRAGRSAEAIALYRKALASHPRWAEGWWQLGTLLYDADAYADAAAAFRECTDQQPDIGTSWVMLGLSEFKVGQFEQALLHIQKGRRLGIPADPQFRRVMTYHEGVLLLRVSEFERAQETLDALAADDVNDDDLILALGMSVLRLKPAELPESDVSVREPVRRAGIAEQLAARKQFDQAERAYEQLAADNPQLRNVHYALGRYFVATRQPEKAVAAYEQEIARAPDHVPAHLGIAAIKSDTDPATALRYAEEAVRLNSRIPLGHYLLGMLLLHTPDTARAITELEIARRAVPEDPGVHYALGRAYAKAGRSADARRARAEFRRLTEARQAAARRAPSVDAAADERPR